MGEIDAGSLRDDQPLHLGQATSLREESAGRAQTICVSRWEKLLIGMRHQECHRLRSLVLKANQITWQSKVAQLEKEMTKQNDQHLQRVMKERERHLQLYNFEAEAINLRTKVESMQTTIADQREEIKNMLTRLSKYAPREFRDSDADQVQGEAIDLVRWQLTREAATDEALIAQLREQVGFLKQELENHNDGLVCPKAGRLVSKSQT
jgi:hypothetical protein